MKVKSRKITVSFPLIKSLRKHLSNYKAKLVSFISEKIKKLSKPKEVVYDNVLTYEPKNGWHIWDYDDTILSLTFFRIKELVRKKTGVLSYGMSMDYSIIDKELKKLIDINIKTLADEIIGCAELTLDVNSKVTEHFVTGADTGLIHPNKHQINLSIELKEKSIDELVKMSKKIIKKISNDEFRMSQNKLAKDRRLKSLISNNNKKSNKTKQETIDKINKRIKKQQVKDNLTEIEITETITIKVGDITNHDKFGIGEVIELLHGVSVVNFYVGKRAKNP